MYHLRCTYCTRAVQENAAIGRTPICRDSMVNHMFRNTFPMRDYCNNTPKPRRAGVRCTTSAMVCTSCTRGVQENAAIGLVRTPICRDSRVNHMFRNTFPMRDN